MRSYRLARVLGAVLPLAALILAPLGSARAQTPAPGAGEFPLRNGDTWVMVGDSITAQHLHSNYFEAFCFARFPNLTFRFRNSGVGGDRIPTALDRWKTDVIRWRPNLISVELGMNDASAGPNSVGPFIEGMSRVVAQTKAANARPVILSPSPVNDGSSPSTWRGQSPLPRNAILERYAAALAEFSLREQIPYADQFHLLAPVWGRNTALFNAYTSARQAIAHSDLPGVDQLQAWLKTYEASGVRPVNLMGDPVHPGPPGQLLMAAALLTGLKAPGLVSQVTLDLSGGPRLVEAKQCAVSGLQGTGESFSFNRTDQSLPFPIPDNARPALELTRLVHNLSQYTLTVKGLKSGSYEVKIDDVAVGTVSHAQLEQGWNLGVLEGGPIADQGRAILQAVSDKEGAVGRWRAFSQASGNDPTPEAVVKLAEIERQVMDADSKIRAAARPKPHRFAVTKQ